MGGAVKLLAHKLCQRCSIMSVDSFISQFSKLDMISKLPYNNTMTSSMYKNKNNHNNNSTDNHHSSGLNCNHEKNSSNGHHEDDVNGHITDETTNMVIEGFHEPPTEEEARQLQQIDTQISNLESKIETFWEICKVLEEEFVTAVRNAEIEHDFKLISKANSLKRKSERKMVEIEELEKELDSTLEKKRQFLYHK